MEKKYILSEVPDVFVNVFLLLVSADELIVCIVPEVERLGMSGGQALDHRDPTNLDLMMMLMMTIMLLMTPPQTTHDVLVDYDDFVDDDVVDDPTPTNW